MLTLRTFPLTPKQYLSPFFLLEIGEIAWIFLCMQGHRKDLQVLRRNSCSYFWGVGGGNGAMCPLNHGFLIPLCIISINFLLFLCLPWLSSLRCFARLAFQRSLASRLKMAFLRDRIIDMYGFDIRGMEASEDNIGNLLNESRLASECVRLVVHTYVFEFFWLAASNWPFYTVDFFERLLPSLSFFLSLLFLGCRFVSDLFSILACVDPLYLNSTPL